MRKVILQPSERILMEELWDENPQTITQLFHTLNEKCGWTKSTVSTMLNRMSRKGLLRFEQGRVFKGSVSMMMSTLLKERKLKPEEIQELYDMLKEAKK